MTCIRSEVLQIQRPFRVIFFLRSFKQSTSLALTTLRQASQISVLSKAEFFILQDEVFESRAATENSKIVRNELKGLTTTNDAESLLEGPATGLGITQRFTEPARFSKKTPEVGIVSSLKACQVSSISDVSQPVIVERVADLDDMRTRALRRQKRSNREKLAQTSDKIQPQDVVMAQNDCASSSAITHASAIVKNDLFEGLVFYFVPNSRTSVARNLRMKKVEQFGGVIVSKFDVAQVTHIIADQNLTASMIQISIGLSFIPESIRVYNEFWTPECVMYGRLIEVSDRYLVAGTEHCDPLQTSAQMATKSVSTSQIRKEMSLGQESSLQIKKSKTIESQRLHTPEHCHRSISPSIAFLNSSLSTSELVQNTLRPQDELDETVKVVQQLVQVMFDEELPNSKEASLSWQSSFKRMTPHITSSKASSTQNVNDFVIDKVSLLQKP